MFQMKKSIAVVLAVGALIGAIASGPAQADGDGFTHHVVLHVDDNDAAKMNLALNNAANVVKYYQAKNERVKIEIVAYGPGLHMLRADTSPVKDRLVDFAPSFPDVAFAACGNTIVGMTKAEGKEPPLIADDSIAVVPSGVVQIMMRQDEGWHYIKP